MAEQRTMTLHLYRNEVVDWFAAESLEQAITFARAHYQHEETFGDDMLVLKQEPDDKVLTMWEDDTPGRQQTAAEWALENGPGFWGSTNY
jgi:hypothetical protein